MDLASATEALLAAWRANRHPELAAAIARAGSLAAQTAPPEVPSEHPAFVTRIVTTPVVRWMQNLLAIEAQLRRCAPDPRIGRWAANELVSGGLSRAAEEAFLALLERHGSHELLPLLANATVKRPRVGRLEALRARLSAMEPRPLDKKERELVEAVDRAHAEARERDPRLLLELALERPDDEGIVQVWADSLVEKGDPRGEFVQLQFLHERGGGDDATRTREAQLWRKHWRSWFADVAAILAPTTTRCRRGLLFRAGIHTPEGAPLAQVFRQPSFSTVREVVFHGIGGRWAVVHLPPTIEAVWNLVVYDESGLGPQPWKRVGLAHFSDGALRSVLRDASALEVLALDVGVYQGGLAEALAPVERVRTLCLGGVSAEEVRAVLPSLWQRGVAEVRVGRAHLAAWDDPTVVYRPTSA
jgi:hypothetical protein